MKMNKNESFQRSALARSMAWTIAPVALLAFSQHGSAAPGIEEVVVTAQRKTELLQEIPLSVNVVTADTLGPKGLTTTVDLPTVVPGMAFAYTGGAATPYLRGIGSNAGNPNDEPSVAMYIDGVYIATPFANIMNFNSIQRVEVLKGPQGTLFGRNATGGVIQLVTRDPTEQPLLEISAGAANYRTATASLYASGPLLPNLTADLSIQGETQDEGWGKALARDEETHENRNSSVRTKFLFTPNDATEVRLALDHAEVYRTVDYRLPPGVVGLDGQVSPSDKYDTNGNIVQDGVGTPKMVSRQDGAALTIDYEMEDVHFVSISAYRETRGVYDAEADTTPIPGVEARLPIDQKSLSQEFQLLSTGTSWLDWTLGAFIYRNEAGYDHLKFGGLAFGDPPMSGIGVLLLDTEQISRSHSVYAQGAADIFTDTQLTLGLRYTHERQEFNSVIFGNPIPSPKDRGFDEPTWRVALDHAFSGDVHAYVSYNRGVKGGGFDLLSPGSDGFEPEILDAYEIGVKSVLFDRRLRLNGAFFYYDYQDIQVQVIPAGGAGIVATTNAAKAVVQGFDVDFTFEPIDHLSISGGFAILDGEYDDFENTVSYPASPLSGPSQVIDASGNDTIRTPKYSGNLTLAYRVQSAVGEFPLSITYSYTDNYYFGADSRLEQEAYGLVNASAGWEAPGGGYGVRLWGRNLTDEFYWAQGVPSGFGDLMEPAAPRTYGITFYAKFGGE